MEQFLGLPPDASVDGHQIDNLIVIVHWIMFALFAGWGGFYLYTLVRFRKSKHPQANYYGVKSHSSNYLEVAVAIVEAVLLIGFSIPLWSVRVSAFPSEKDAVVVSVVGEQFAWNIHYPGRDRVFGRRDIKLVDPNNPLGLDLTDPAAKDDITTINQLYLPVGKPVIVHLTSKDVIHSFSIPYLRVKQDVIPGMSIPLWFVAAKTSREVQKETAGKYSIAPVSMSTKLALGRVVADDYTGQDGNVVVRKGEMVAEGMDTLLMAAGVHNVLVTPDLFGKVAMMDYADNDGSVIVKQREPIFDDAILKLNALGLPQILAAPETPMEIACAQLCGLGHFRMRGFVTIYTEEEFNTWMAEQEALLGNEVTQETTPQDQPGGESQPNQEHHH